MRMSWSWRSGLRLGLAGCILKAPGTPSTSIPGAVVWTVLEEDVRSDTEAAADREREECEVARRRPERRNKRLPAGLPSSA